MCIDLGIICFFLAGRNRLFLNQYTCLLTAVTHGRARKKQIIPKPIHMSTYRSYTWKSQEETDYSFPGSSMCNTCK
jgi:hypothetical protein